MKHSIIYISNKYVQPVTTQCGKCQLHERHMWFNITHMNTMKPMSSGGHIRQRGQRCMLIKM